MFAKIKPSIFIDALQLELSAPHGSNFLRGVLRDDKGSICSTFSRDIMNEKEHFTWTGLSHLPYGKYTIELSQGEDEMKMNLVKRI
jgi:hypothetical protein